MMRTDILAQAKAIKESMDKAASFLTDTQAVQAPRIYPVWKADMEVKAGDRIYYEGTQRLYKVNENMGHTTQVGWEPDKTPAMFTVIEVEHTGTQEDPITAARGMEYTYGLYYSDPEDSKLYKCERSGETDGNKIILQYLPHELIGIYFTLVK